MTAAVPDGTHEPFPGLPDRGAAGLGSLPEEWVAVLEFVPAGFGRRFAVGDVDNLLGELREWDPIALFNSDRYAIQLRIPAAAAHLALTWALVCHGRAAQATGMPAATMVRAEICTVEEFERPYPETAPAAAPTVGGVLCDELYTATRGLVAATTAAEVTDTIVAFVIAVGGRVESGNAPDDPTTTDIDLSLEGNRRWYARADALSVAGLIIEQSLPTLLDDAHTTLAHFPLRHSRTQPVPTMEPTT